MAEPRPLVSPILVGRDDLLRLADRRRAEARGGHGWLLLLAGEAGIGKTRLATAIGRRAAAEGFAVAQGHTYPGDVDVAAGALIDLARSMRRVPVLAATGAELGARLEASADAGDSGDLHRRRRILVLDAVDLLADAPARAGSPVLLVLEDLHWVDDVSLEILSALARRLPDLPLLVVASVRTDELYPMLPVRAWRSALLAGRLAEELRVERLDRAGTGAVIAALLGPGLPPPRDLVDAVHARSDGVPLHVEELLALARSEAPGARDGPAPGRLQVPETLEEAVLGRAARLPSAARRAADAASVIGRSFEPALLASVLGRPADRVAALLADLQRAFIVAPAVDASRLDFRHALIRDALYGAVDPVARRRLHARVADATAGDPRFGPAYRSVHLELAGRDGEAFEASLAGGRVAAGLSAHREARDLLERALRTAPRDLPARRRAEVLSALADEAAATDDNRAADAWYAQAAGAFRAAGAIVEAADVAPRHVAVRHLLGEGLAARVARLEAALEAVEAAARSPRDPASGGDPAATRVRGHLLAGLSASNMLDRRLEPAIELGDAGRRLAEAAGDKPTALDIAATVGACLVFAGRMDEGWAMLDDAVVRSRAARLEAQAARSYRMLASCASVLVEYDLAEARLREGIAYAEGVELWNHRHYLAAHLGHVLWATGAWEEARQVASHALADGRGGITTRITALYVLGYVALGRGDHERAEAMLGEGLALAEGMGELQRVSPVLWGLAEHARLRGDAAGALGWCERGAAASAAVEDAAYLFPFLLTGTRANLDLGDPAAAERWLARTAPVVERRSIPGTLPALDHARGLVALARGSSVVARERLEAALAGWTARRRRWEATLARLDLATLHARANRLADAARQAEAAKASAASLGAGPVADEAEALLRRLRARAPIDAAWAPLTARELEVAREIAHGATNPEIAATLGVSVRTVTAHVEHILAKLGATRRAEIAVWVTRVVPGEAAEGARRLPA